MLPRNVQSAWITLNGLRIHYLTAGEGSPVILLHGGGLNCAALSWSEVIGPLSAHHRVFAPDLPGFGESDRPDVEYTSDYFLRFLVRFMDAMYLERANLVGLSLGGGIAINFTLNNPARVDKLVLANPYYGFRKRSHDLRMFFIARLGWLQELSTRLMSTNRDLAVWIMDASGVVDPARLNDDLLDEIIPLARKGERAFISWQVNECTWKGPRTSMGSRLGEINAPTLLLHAALDKSVPVDDALHAHPLMCNSELQVLQGCRQWMTREKPEEFCKEVGEFLQRDAVVSPSRPVPYGSGAILDIR